MPLTTVSIIFAVDSSLSVPLNIFKQILHEFFKKMDVGRENGNFGTILLDGGLYALVELGDDFTQAGYQIVLVNKSSTNVNEFS